MSYQSESQLERELVEHLLTKGWEAVSIADETALWKNLQLQLGLHNGTVYSDTEFSRIRIHLEKGSQFDKAHTLRERFQFFRDDGKPAYVEFFNTREWCRNRYQVATQIGIDGRRKNRYDVTLLINGLPLCQIELKRSGVELKAAFNQINRYQKDSFTAAGGLFQYVQIFVISNGVNTRYYANNRHQTFAQTFAWGEDSNSPINRLGAFADVFLEKCHLSKMISKYVVLHYSDGILMVLRSYQYYAAEAIANRVQNGRQNGYIWHTTGSGKTLTSYKAAQNLIDIPEVQKVCFVVDRADLDYQTTKEFNHFRPGSVDGTDDTKSLVRQLRDKNTDLVVTTIQKLNTAIQRFKYSDALDSVRHGRIVFVFDECHRSQFGTAHRNIERFFPNAQMFGFTGTPIFAPNSVGKRTTKDLFTQQLHSYVITDAIRDENVLRFAIEYVYHADEEAKELAGKEFFEHPERIETVVDWVLKNHSAKTRNRQFGAIMCVGSVDSLIRYYDSFRAKKIAGDHDLNIAAIFTYAANEDDPDADGLIPDIDFPGDTVSATVLPKRDKLVKIVQDYNEMFGVQESVLDGKGFYTYYKSIAKRVKARDRKPFVREQGIDILIVVNMFLTGFDSKTVNTLYVDKNLRYHGLIQAFSRTNRVLGPEKSQGNIVCFRDLKTNTDEAIALFADKNAQETVIVPNYAEQLEKLNLAVERLLSIVPNADSVDSLRDEDAKTQFVKAFREVLRLRNILTTYSEFEDSHIPLHPQAFEDFKSKYLDLADGVTGGGSEEVPDALDGIDFELELIRRDEINVAYILALLASMSVIEKRNGRSSRKAQEQRQRILEILRGEITLREKGPYIEKFMNIVLPTLSAEDDLHQAFSSFWREEEAAAFAAFQEEHGLEEQPFKNMLSRMRFTGKLPLGEDIVKALKTKPSILQRKAVTDQIVNGMSALRRIFDQHIGDIESGV